MSKIIDGIYQNAYMTDSQIGIDVGGLNKDRELIFITDYTDNGRMGIDSRPLDFTPTFEIEYNGIVYRRNLVTWEALGDNIGGLKYLKDGETNGSLYSNNDTDNGLAPTGDAEYMYKLGSLSNLMHNSENSTIINGQENKLYNSPMSYISGNQNRISASNQSYIYGGQLNFIGDRIIKVSSINGLDINIGETIIPVPADFTYDIQLGDKVKLITDNQIGELVYYVSQLSPIRLSDTYTGTWPNGSIGAYVNIIADYLLLISNLTYGVLECNGESENAKTLSTIISGVFNKINITDKHIVKNVNNLTEEIIVSKLVQNNFIAIGYGNKIDDEYNGPRLVGGVEPGLIGTYSNSIINGQENKILGYSSFNTLINGKYNVIKSGYNSHILNGLQNTIDNESFIGESILINTRDNGSYSYNNIYSGRQNTISKSGNHNNIYSGFYNNIQINTFNDILFDGYGNPKSGYNNIIVGYNSNISTQNSPIFNNMLLNVHYCNISGVRSPSTIYSLDDSSRTIDVHDNIILNGYGSYIDGIGCNFNMVGVGHYSSINGNGLLSYNIVNGDNNHIRIDSNNITYNAKLYNNESTHNIILNGYANNIIDSISHSGILSGRENTISGYAQNCFILNANQSFIRSPALSSNRYIIDEFRPYITNCFILSGYAGVYIEQLNTNGISMEGNSIYYGSNNVSIKNINNTETNRNVIINAHDNVFITDSNTSLIMMGSGSGSEHITEIINSNNSVLYVADQCSIDSSNNVFIQMGRESSITNASNSFILYGYDSHIKANDSITQKKSPNFILSGYRNNINDSMHSFIANGYRNTLHKSEYSSIGGYGNSVINANSFYNHSMLNGFANKIVGDFSSISNSIDSDIYGEEITFNITSITITQTSGVGNIVITTSSNHGITTDTKKLFKIVNGIIGSFGDRYRRYQLLNKNDIVGVTSNTITFKYKPISVLSIQPITNGYILNLSDKVDNWLVGHSIELIHTNSSVAGTYTVASELNEFQITVTGTAPIIDYIEAGGYVYSNILTNEPPVEYTLNNPRLVMYDTGATCIINSSISTILKSSYSSIDKSSNTIIQESLYSYTKNTYNCVINSSSHSNIYSSLQSNITTSNYVHIENSSSISLINSTGVTIISRRNSSNETISNLTNVFVYGDANTPTESNRVYFDSMNLKTLPIGTASELIARDSTGNLIEYDLANIITPETFNPYIEPFSFHAGEAQTLSGYTSYTVHIYCMMNTSVNSISFIIENANSNVTVYTGIYEVNNTLNSATLLVKSAKGGVGGVGNTGLKRIDMGVGVELQAGKSYAFSIKATGTISLSGLPSRTNYAFPFSFSGLDPQIDNFTPKAILANASIRPWIAARLI